MLLNISHVVIDTDGRTITLDLDHHRTAASCDGCANLTTLFWTDGGKSTATCVPCMAVFLRSGAHEAGARIVSLS